MTEVRELGQWCGGGGRNSDPDACHRAYATTFPNDYFTSGYFRTPREYRSPNVRVQRQRCVHNGLEGDEGRCTMEAKQYQCPMPISINCSRAYANDIQRPPQNRWCSSQTTKETCEASYARAGEPWTVSGGLRGRNYRACVWKEGEGCKLQDVGFNCRDPDQEALCIDVWNSVVVSGATCGGLSRELARAERIGYRTAAARIGATFAVCEPCARSS